jgi:hypothetical protein
MPPDKGSSGHSVVRRICGYWGVRRQDRRQGSLWLAYSLPFMLYFVKYSFYFNLLQLDALVNSGDQATEVHKLLRG